MRKKLTQLSGRNEVIGKYIFMFLCFLFLGAIFLRNMPYSSVLGGMVEGINRYVLDPLGLTHHGWGMFSGTTTSTIMVRVNYTFKDGSTKLEEPFPLRSAIIRSPWTEVLEVILVRDNKNDPQRNYRFGYFTYQCQNKDWNSPLIKAEVQKAVIPIQELYTNNGQPLNSPNYITNYTMTCENNLK